MTYYLNAFIFITTETHNANQNGEEKMSTFNEIKDMTYIDALLFADQNFDDVEQDFENETSTFEDEEGQKVIFCGVSNTFKKV